MCGADNRYEMLRDTIEKIEPYFDKIHIIDNGSTDSTPRLADYSSKIIYKRIDHWDGNWTTCYYEAIKEICENEWFIFHDSDERPSPQFLKNLRKIVRWADQGNLNVLAVQSCHHHYDDRGQLCSNYEQVINQPGFVKWNFIKRQNMVIKAFGGHTGFHLSNPRVRLLREFDPQCFYNHYKSTSSTRLSAFAHGFMFPNSMDGLKPYAAEILSVREKLGIDHIQQLYHMLYTKEIPEPMLQLIANWEFAKAEAREVWELIIRDQCKFNLCTHCDKPCCSYF
ncbi:MAG: glycosyltransferase [Chlamydiia bacterium]|nr:glycosyltransferase [Chlamydiia bacterium]